MSRGFHISSDNRRVGESTDDFTIYFTSPLELIGNNAIALTECNVWYSWNNIHSDYGNQLFRYYNGSSYKTITIPNGTYSIDDLNNYVHSIMKANGDYTTVSGVDTFSINLTPNYNTFKLDITIANSYKLDLSTGTLYVMLGFSAQELTSSQSGTSNVDITNGVSKILLHCDLCTGGYQSGTNSDIILSFQANDKPSSLLEIKPFRPIFLATNKSDKIQSIRFYLTDTLSRRVNLNGESLNITLEIKKL